MKKSVLALQTSSNQPQSMDTTDMFDIEHRYHQQLQAYWEQLKGNRRFPLEREINPDEIEEIWPSCFLVSIDSVTKTTGYRYSYLGHEMQAAYGEEPHNPDIVHRLDCTDTSRMIARFDEVLATGQPVIDESSFINTNGLHIRYRTCMLPLGLQDHTTVGYILGCMRWKAY